MAKTIIVDWRQLENAAGRIESLAGDYKTQYDLLYSEAGNLASTYQGRDYVAFANQIEGFKEDFAKMHAHMLAYADFLHKSAKSYKETQETIIDNSRKLRN